MARKQSDEDTVEAIEDSHLLLNQTSNKTSEHLKIPSTSFKPSPIDKYTPALKTLIPIRPFEKSDHEHPCDTAGLFSTATFSWMTVLVWNAFKKPPSVDDLWKLSQYDQAEPNYDRFSRLWDDEIQKHGRKGASVWRVVLRFIKTRLIMSTLCILLYAFAVFSTSSFIMHLLLSYVSQRNSTLSYGIILVSILFCVEVLRSSITTLLYAINYRSAIRTRSAMVLFMFKKVLKLSSANTAVSVGELVNLCSNDGDRIFEANRMGNLILVGPMLFVAGTIYSTVLLGPIGLFGALIFLATILLQGVLVKAMNKLREKAIVLTELRVKNISEILTFIKLIKMYCWEESFAKRVINLRQKELRLLKMMAFLQSMNVSLAFFTPVLASVVMFSAYIVLGYNLTAQNAFTCIAVFNMMSFGLKVMPLGIRSLADVTVAMGRFRKIMLMDDMESYVQQGTKDKSNAVEISGATFSWQTPREIDDLPNSNGSTRKPSETEDLIQDDRSQNLPLVLKHIDLTIPKGSLVGVCGHVGAGKSSLISALIGQLHLVEGSVALDGALAYATQQAWLMNATIRENVVFGLQHDEKKYQDAIAASGLLDDLDIFPSGDLTEVGDRGINLSGGQKQRISLARALYSDRDIYLLDDPLSAVDVHVGKHIFNEAILSQLKKNGKTVLLVTHQLQYLPKCDQVVLMEHGKIKEIKSFEALFQDNTDLASLGISSLGEEDKLVKEDPSVKSTSTKSAVDSEKELLEQGRLMTKEERGGVIPASVYFAYIKAGSGFFAAFLVLLFFAFNVGVQQFTNLWLSLWLNLGSVHAKHLAEVGNFTALALVDTSGNFSQNVSTDTTISPNMTQTTVPSIIDPTDITSHPQFKFYLLVYFSSAVFMLLVSVLRGFSFMTLAFTAMKNLHNNMFTRILNAPMEFFDTTPSGRIINRFQKDMDEADAPLPIIWEMFFFNFMTLIFATGLIAYVFPKFLIVVVVICPILVIACIMFKPAAREMKRLDNMTRSPWFAHITTTISGLDTIRAYQSSSRFVDEFIKQLDKNAIPCYLFACINRWLAVRLDLLMILTCVFATLFVIIYRDIVSPASAGLALSSAFLMSGMLQFTIRLLNEGEARFVSIDRIKYYIDNVIQEKSDCDAKATEDWPKKGVVEFRNVCMRYREGLPLALNNISFKLNPSEKIGVVGRTGSGKSSLAVTLFRLVEVAEGNILIDDLDIGTISLKSLRSKLAIIPQDPVLFTGTVRYNLDPFDHYKEEELWKVLEQTHLKASIQKLPEQLDSALSENGSNLSVGERQLMCLARALLRQSKILVLDEATAAVDGETEKIVQETIQASFVDCTLITIAHRLASVMTCDRIMVLSEGRLVEFDSPQTLLNNQSSVFARMMAATH
uniref:Multidrug resistance-associated protein 5 n=1 Tax=Phallusia mammillata TaxID=59560 RepID=A0A6F9D4Y5_9ASCI|nr:multidrug resistance-associated protein 5 [Phallusia mammillata]